MDGIAHDVSRTVIQTPPDKRRMKKENRDSDAQCPPSVIPPWQAGARLHEANQRPSEIFKSGQLMTS